MIRFFLIFSLTLMMACANGDPQIVSRSQWGATAPRKPASMRLPVPRVVIHHTDTRSCTNQEACSSILKIIQNYHMNTKNWSDIGYNFLVGEDGRVYEGRGWNRVGAHVRIYNDVSIGISVMGNYTTRAPNLAAVTAVQQLIASGVQQGKISSTYTLHGHRDLGNTTCPGNAFYRLVRTWPHHKGRP